MNLFFLPYERWTIHTTLSAEEIRQRLAENVEEADVYRSGHIFTIRTPYQGKLEPDRFEIARVIDYGQEFLPLVRGTLREDGNRRAIDLVIRPQGVMLALFVIGVVAATGAVCFALSDALFGTALGSPGTNVAITAPLLLAFLVTVYIIYFKTESFRARKFLTGIFG